MTIAEIETELNLIDGGRFLNLRPDGFVEVGPAETRHDDGYLGCTATARKPRAGEQQHRGNDLSDGPLDEATWHRIICDIVSYELVKVHRTTDDVGLAEAGNHLPGSTS